MAPSPTNVGHQGYQRQRSQQHLARLTNEVSAFVTEQKSLARARAMIQTADQHSGALPLEPAGSSNRADDHQSWTSARTVRITRRC